MEEILGTTQLQIPLRRGVKRRISALELIVEPFNERLRIWGASLSWIDSNDILQVQTGVLVSENGEALAMAWTKEVLNEVEFPILVYGEVFRRLNGSPPSRARSFMEDLKVERHVFQCTTWTFLPDWTPTVPSLKRIGLRKRGDATVATDLTRFHLALTYSLRRFQNLSQEDSQEIYRAYSNLTPISTGSVSWGIG